MYNEQKKWFSQTLMYYEDKYYQTEGKLRISISTNTSDDINYNSPYFNISISHNFQKTCNLNIYQATDLVNSFKNFMSNPTFDGIEILKRINSSTELSILFKKDLNENPVVELVIRSSSTDYTKIIVIPEVFSAFAHRLKNFVNNYDQLCYQLLMNNINNEERSIIKQLPGLIRGISSQIVSTNYIDNGALAAQEPVEQAPVEQTIAELDNFLGGGEMSNVRIPEIEEKKIEDHPPFYEVNSPFVNKLLNNKIENLENILTIIDGSNEPINIFIRRFLITMIDDNVSYLPGISENDLKSTLYISKVLCAVLTKSHINYNTLIPTSTPILLYKVKEFKDINLDIAYDILLCFSYMRAMRNRLNEKVSDFIINKTRSYLQMRLYLDIFCFSFLEKADKNKIRSIISNRYKYYDSIGFFDTYKKQLKDNNCIEIKEYDIDIFVSEACDKIIGKAMSISEQQDHMVKNNSFRIPSSNNFTLEQIINEAIPLEIDEKSGIDITKVEYASKEVLNWFLGDQKTQVIKQSDEEKKSNLVRYVSHYRNEIPEQHRDTFLKWLESFQGTDFDFKMCKYPLAEFGSNIIKALYIWKPSEDEKITKGYKHYVGKIEDCLLDKTHILSIDEIKETKETEEWTNAFDNIKFE